MSATLVVTNEAFELLWRSQSYCFMTPAAVENLRKCHAQFLADKSLHGTRCRTVVRKYWRHVPLPQPPEHNHGANMCLIDLSTWPAPPPDAVEVMETDCTMYHLDKDFVLWTVHPAEHPEAMVHSIRVLEIARLIQWMKPRAGPHPHPKSRSLVVVDGSDMTILATYPPGVMQHELRLGSSVFEIVGDEDRDSFAERPPTKLLVPNPKDHGRTRRMFDAVPIALLDGFVFVIEEADEEDPSVAAAAQSMVSLSTGTTGGRSAAGFQHLSALIREDAQAPPVEQAQQELNSEVLQGSGLSSSPSLPSLQHVTQLHQHEAHASAPAQNLAPPPPALHPQWSSHPPTLTVPMPTLSAKPVPSNLPSWQLPPLPKYRDSYYAATNVPTPASSNPSTTWSPAPAPPAPASASSDRVHRPLPRIHPPRIAIPVAPPMLLHPAAAAAAAPGAMYESPRSMTFDSGLLSAKDAASGFALPIYGREFATAAAQAAVYPPLLSPMSSVSSGPLSSTYPSRSSTASAAAAAGASEQSWYGQQQQHPGAARSAAPNLRYRTFDGSVPNAAVDRAMYPPMSHHRPATYHHHHHQPQFAPAHDALGEVYFEPPVFPTPPSYPSSYTRGLLQQPPPHASHARLMPSFPGAQRTTPYTRPAAATPRADEVLPQHLAGPYHDERYGMQEYYPPPQHQQQPPPAPPLYASNNGYPPHRPQPHQFVHHPSSHAPADVYPPLRDHHEAYMPQPAAPASRHAAWAPPQYAGAPGPDPYAHAGGYHGMHPPAPLMAPGTMTEPAGAMYPLEHGANAELDTESSARDVHGTGAPRFGTDYGHKSGVDQPQLTHPRQQEWQARDYRQAVYESAAQDPLHADHHEPMSSELDDDAQYAPQHFVRHVYGQSTAGASGEHGGGGDMGECDDEEEDDEEDAPILDLGHIAHAAANTSSSAAAAPRSRSKRSTSSRAGQRVSSGRRKRGISPPLTRAAAATDHSGDDTVGGFSSKFVAGYVNPRYPMRPSPHGVPCSRCGMLESPEWRRGETGIRDLCNACGLKYYREKKQREKVSRRAAAASSTVVAGAHGPCSSVTQGVRSE